MKKFLLTLSMAVAVTALGTAPFVAEAKRLGGGKPAGLQRQMPATPVKPATPPTPAQAPGAQQAAPAAAGAAAAAAAPAKRSWMGPLAGLAAGIGLAALFSHLGMGEGLANVVMIVLLALVAFAVLRFVLSRLGSKRQGNGPMGGYNLAGAGASAGGGHAGLGNTGAGGHPASPSWTERSALNAANPSTPAQGASAASTPASAPAMPVATEPALPAGVDRDDFLRLAKMVFIRLQAANDSANIDDIRKFTTPELFASLRLDLQDRGAAKQQTDVVQLDAEIADVTRDGMGQDVVSVRYSGLIREEAEGGAQTFAELWHLVRPVGGEWAIAGITPL